jgi:hypothetical protein
MELSYFFPFLVEIRSVRLSFLVSLAAAYYAYLGRMSSNNFDDRYFWCIELLLSACVIADERGVKTANGKIKKEQEQTEAQPDGA